MKSLTRGAAAIALAAAFTLGNGLAAETSDRLLGAQETQDLIAQSKNIFYLDRDKTLDTVLAEAGSKPVFVMFHAEWCPYCKALRPILVEEFTKKFPHDEARLVIVDIDIHRQFRRPVPQVVPYHNGQAGPQILSGLPGVTRVDGRNTLNISEARAEVMEFLKRGVRPAPAPAPNP